MADNEQDESQTEGGQEKTERRQSKLTTDEVDALLEQSAQGVRDLRATLEQVFRLPRSRTAMRLR